MRENITTIPFTDLNFSDNPDIPSLEAQYSQRLNPQLKKFINFGQKNSDDIEDVAKTSVHEQRQRYNYFCTEISKPRKQKLNIKNFTVPKDTHITLRHYLVERSNTSALILFFHGGGFVVGNLDTHDDICQELAIRTNTEVIAVDYRLAPEHLFPAAADDCFLAYQYVQELYPERHIILCGDSAGGTLSAGVINQSIAEKFPTPKAQILVYPSLGGDPQTGSYQQHRHAPELSLADVALYSRLYLGDTVPVNDPRCTPLCLDDFSLIPPTICLVCELDPIADDGIQYCEKLTGYKRLHVAKGLTHGTWRLFRQIDQVAECWDWLASEYHQLLSHLHKP